MHYRHTYTLVRACVYALQTHVYTCHDARACPSLFSQHVKDSATTAGLAASVCSTLRGLHFKSHKSHTSLFSQHVKDSATTAGLAPCERAFHAQVCALHRTHLSILAAHQRQRHDGRACPLRACVPRSGVCIPPHTPLYSRSTSKTAPRWQGLPPASVCSTLRCVRLIAHTSLFSQHVKDSATNKSDLSAARPRSSYASDRLLALLRRGMPPRRLREYRFFKS